MKKKKNLVSMWLFIPIIIMAAISVGFAVNDHQTLKTGVFTEDTAFPMEFTAETTKAVKTAILEVTEHEQTASEEETKTEAEHMVRVECNVVEQTDVATVESDWNSTNAETMAAKIEDEPPYYCYKGIDYLDHNLQYHLWDLWNRFDMPKDWYVYMIGLIYQECSFTPNPHYNADGTVDIGYFQYNNKWFFDKAVKAGHPELDINNKYHQAFLFVLETRNRMLQGFSMEECISKHRTGDYDAYNPEYVALVKERTDALRNE